VKIELNEKNTAAEFRALVMTARENGWDLDLQVELAVIFADFLRIPDGEPLIPALERTAKEYSFPISISLQ
jgi:hypothetical protein